VVKVNKAKQKHTTKIFVRLHDCLISPVLIVVLKNKKKCVLNWPLPIGAFQYKQTMITKYSNEHNYVNNPNWQEADQLAIYKHSRVVELGVTENNIS